MKKLMKIWLVSVMMVMMMTITAFAEPTGTVNVNLPEKVQVGTEYTITVTVSMDAEVSAVSGKFDYPSATTEYVSGADGVAGGGKVALSQATAQTSDNKTFVWTLTYRATAESAEAKFAVQNLEATVVDAQAAGGDSVSFPVPEAIITSFTTEAVEQPTEAPASTEAVQEPAATEVVDADAQMTAWLQKEQEVLAETNSLTALILTDDPTEEKVRYVAESYKAEDLPLHFSEYRCVYKGVEIKGAALNGTEILTVFVTDSNGKNGEWVYYYPDREHTKFEEIKRIGTDTGNFLLLLKPEESQIPKNFQATKMDMGLSQFDAWTTGGSYTEGGVAADPTEFYLVYGCNQNGHEGWFIYDSMQGSYLRYVEFTGGEVTAAATDAASANTNSALQQKYDFVMTCAKYAGVAILALLILLIIVNFTGNKEDVEEYEEEEDEEEDDDDIVLPMTRKERKAAKKAAKKAKLDAMTDEDGFVDDYNFNESPAESDYIQESLEKTPIAKEKKSNFDDEDDILGALKPLVTEEKEPVTVDLVMEKLEETAKEVEKKTDADKKAPKEEKADIEEKLQMSKEEEIAKLLDSVSDDIRKTVENEQMKDTDFDSELTFIDID